MPLVGPEITCTSRGGLRHKTETERKWIGLIDWLIDYLLFYAPLKNISLIWRRHHYRWRAAKFRPMLSAQGLWAVRELYRATPAVTQGLGFSGLIRRTTPFNRLLRHTRGCRGPTLTRILMGQMDRKRWNLDQGLLISTGKVDNLISVIITHPPHTL
jgi:hypothetical protein